MLRSSIRAGARVAIAGGTFVLAWGAASSLVALGWAVDLWTDAVGGTERSR